MARRLGASASLLRAGSRHYGVCMSESIEVSGPPTLWEARCLEQLNRWPFRIIRADEGGPEGREFVAEYRDAARVPLALVYVDVGPASPGGTTLRLRAERAADNPFRMLFRDVGAEGDSNGNRARLLHDE
jgi:hypothetical protein